MQEIANVLIAARGTRDARLAAQKVFLERRAEIWRAIAAGEFPDSYTSHDSRKFVGAPRRTAIRCDFLLANKAALGSKYRTDAIADAAQRDLLFYVLRDREVFGHRTGGKFYCCPRCTSKLYECVCADIFRYVDNKKWKAQIERGGINAS